jgi:porin
VPNDRNLINFYAGRRPAVQRPHHSSPDDKIGVAAGYARVGDNARGLDADIGSFGNFFYPVRSGEVMVEMIYQAQIAPWWMLQPEGPIYLSSGRRRPEQRRKLPTECVGDRAPFRAQLLSRSAPAGPTRRLAVRLGLSADRS